MRRTTLAKQDQAIDGFWRWFSRNITKLNLLAGPSDPFWDVTLCKLKAIAKGLWFELSSLDASPREFIITASGCADLFPLVDRLIKKAPTLDDWLFIALKPPMGFDFEIAYEGIEIDPHLLWFQPLENDHDQLALGLRIGVPHCRPKDRRAIENAVLSILDTALGERAAATEVQHVEVCDLPKSPHAEGYVPLVKLAAYHEWRKRKLQKL